MGTIDRPAGRRWRARWREYPNGPQHSRSFKRKIDAERFLTKVEADLLTGSYVDPRAGSITVEDFAVIWRARRRWRPSTVERVDRDLRLHILPTFGRRPLTAVKRAHVERWAAELGLTPKSVATVHATLSGLFEAAVEDGRIARNPARRATLPRVASEPVVPLTTEQVHRLIDHAPSELRAGVVLAAGSGLRQGELAAVALDRLDFLRRSLRIDRQVWTPRNAPPELVTPKSARSFRTIALADSTVRALAQHLQAHEPNRDGLLFHRAGAPWSRDLLAKAMRHTRDAAGVDATWHSLRHHHASTLLSQGVSPALVAERLGHDVATLLRTYAHVIRSDDDRVRALVDEAMAQRAEYPLSLSPPSG